ncbi:hypothetical protein EMPS_10954 [Entomortierella parvispora]|uniref:Uncharacterized protein n=1 Tax=Entomortierella parvispora TaxID=205924 RepID=A0A9P3M214_9FUNG|nr:hypothetical protein EMPS_10954 [Entomortierella parvispora]
MGLSGFNTFFRYLSFLSGAVAFGFDMYLIYLYQTTPTMYFDWPFYAQTTLVGCLCSILFLSELFYRVGNHYRSYRATHLKGFSHREEEEGAQQLPNPEGHSPADSATFTAPYTTGPPKSYYPPTRREIVDRRRAGLWTCFYFMRFLLVVLISAAILRITIMVFAWSNRSAFTLDYARSSPEADPLSDANFQNVNPRNLFDCPEGDQSWSRPLTYLCFMDQLTETLATSAAGLALIEALLTVILQNRLRRKAHSLPPVLKQVEIYVPSIPLNHLGNEALAATSTVREANHMQKSLPPLPPRDPEEDVQEDIPQAFAYVPDRFDEGDVDQDEALKNKSAWVTTHTNPFMVLDEQSKKMRPVSPTAQNNSSNYADQAPPNQEYDAASGSSSSNAGPSNWYPHHQNDGTS